MFIYYFRLAQNLPVTVSAVWSFGKLIGRDRLAARLNRRRYRRLAPIDSL